MKLKTNPKYKDSGIKWIGEIPEEWGIQKIKHLTENFDGKRIPISAEKREAGEIPYYGATGVLDYVKDFIFNKELLLVGEDGAPFFEPFKDVAYIINGKSWVNNHAHVLRVIGINSIKWLCHYLNIYDYSTVIKGSTRDKLNQDQLSNMIVAKPSIKEQTAIANFLDKKIARTDILIEKDNRLVKLLKEKRIALINHAVTKGLDPNVRMKDSGIEWIGEIPEDWEVKKLKFVTKNIVTGKTPSTENYKYYEKGDINWFTPGDLGVNFTLKESSKKITKLALLEKKAIKYNPNTILLVGIGATLGKVGIITKIGTSNQQINAIEFSENEIYPRYGLYFLHGYKDTLISLSNTSTIGIFNQTQTANFIIIQPSLHEQISIAIFLDEKILQIEHTIQKIEEKIKLLEEYKKSLIHHVVTGKIDVREAV